MKPHQKQVRCKFNLYPLCTVKICFTSIQSCYCYANCFILMLTHIVCFSHKLECCSFRMLARILKIKSSLVSTNSTAMLTLSLPCSSVQTEHKIGKILFSNNVTSPLESTHQELSFEWSVQHF